MTAWLRPFFWLLHQTVRASNRKHFTTDQKHAILDEYEKCLEWGSKAAFIRAVGITEGTMNHWCRQRESGELKSRSDGLREDQRLNAGDKQQLKRVLKENEILKAKLARSEAAMDILGKASAPLDAMAKSAAATEPQLPEPEPGRIFHYVSSLIASLARFSSSPASSVS